VVAEKIRQSLEQPFDLAGRQLNVSSSIGIAIHPEHGEEARQLMRHADDAMYAAKRQGGNRVMPTVLQELHDDTLAS
jgi:diguanylate cyclase (GGDEF)-like protein